MGAVALSVGLVISIQAGQRGRTVLGGAMVLIGLMILSGLGHQVEAFLVRHSPDWLTNLTTRF